jgi:6-phosphogluconolactonase (cycloisomerase 2 family)
MKTLIPIRKITKSITWLLIAALGLVTSACGGAGGGGGGSSTVSGGGGSTPISEVFAYVLNYGSSTVSQDRVNADGTLSSLGSDLAVGAQPDDITVDPKQRFIYVCNEGNTFTSSPPSISTFSIGIAGNLSSVGTTSLSGMPLGAVVDNASSFVVETGINGSVGSATVLAINQSTGGLDSPSTTSLPASSSFFDAPLVSNPSAPFLYDFSSSPNSVYKISGGTLVASSPSTLASSNYGAFDPTGKYAYGSSGSTVYQGVVESDGDIEPNNPASFMLSGGGGSVTVSQSGKFAYIADSTDKQIDEFSVSGGKLTPLATPSIAVVGTPHSVIVDPLERFIYVNVDDPQHPAYVDRFTLSKGAIVSGSQATLFSDPNGHAIIFATK